MSKSAGKKPKEKSDKTKADNFVWTDDEVQLLLEVTNDYKVSKAAKNIDWESCQSKYTDILELYREHYPSSQEESSEIEKEYPHKKEDITKVILTSKLKNIRLKFHQAIDSGKRSGHGRVVLLYFKICESIWGGSPATSTILSGIETGEVEGGCDSIRIDPDSPESPESQDLDTSEASDISTSDRSSDPTSVERTSQPQTTNERRNLLDAKLKGYKTEKLKRKLPAESQFLNLAQEELTIKKQLIEKMNAMDNEYSQNMNRRTSNMEKLSSSIADGFAMLRQMMIQPYGMPPAQPGHTYQSYSMYPHPASSVGRHSSTSNQSESNTGHFSYTQSLLSNDSVNDF